MNNANQKPIMMPLGPVMLDVEALSLSSDDRKRLSHPLTGAVILFSRNYESKAQLRSLIAEIRSIRTPQLLIAVDQEGGRVQRFKQEFSRLPTAASFGDLWQQDKQTAPIRAFESAITMASELLELGVDFSFAPVFDITSVASDVIGDRSFHPDPMAATELLGAYIDGMHTAGMVAIAKHFPGHGGVAGDSHHCLPCDERSLADIENHDLFPYRELINEIQGVMSAHILFSACDSSIPTFSKYWLKDVLRDQLGFEGVVFSDDLTMQGAVEGEQGIVVAAQKAIAAGCDMVLVCNRPDLADEVLHGLDFKITQKHSGRLSSLARRA